MHTYTSREQTVYFAKVFKQDVGKAVEILSDILLQSKLEPAAITLNVREMSSFVKWKR